MANAFLTSLLANRHRDTPDSSDFSANATKQLQLPGKWYSHCSLVTTIRPFCFFCSSQSSKQNAHSQITRQCFFLLLYTKDIRIQGALLEVSHSPPWLYTIPSLPRSPGHSLRRRLLYPRVKEAQQRWGSPEPGLTAGCLPPVQLPRNHQNGQRQEKSKSSSSRGLLHDSSRVELANQFLCDLWPTNLFQADSLATEEKSLSSHLQYLQSELSK